MVKFLKLRGASTYNSHATGAVRRDSVLRVEDAALVERLLEKGEYAEDGHFRPLFVEVPEPKQQQVASASHASGDLSSASLGGPAPQGQEGQEGQEGDGEGDGEGEGEGEGDGEGAEGEGAAPKAAKVVRQRKPAATK